MKLELIKLNIPINFNIIILKNNNNNNNIIILNNKFKFNFFLKKNFKINKNTNTIYFNNIIFNHNFYLLKNNFYKFLEKLNSYYFIKIKFKGKGYKIGFYKKKIINFYFGKSHKSIILYNNIIMKKLTKYKFIILKNNYNILKKISLKITSIKKNNEYTNRGLRASKQIIKKRKGRKGSFI